MQPAIPNSRIYNTSRAPEHVRGGCAARAGREGRESASGSPRVPDRAGTRARARNCHCQQRRHWWRNFGPPAGESTATVATGCSRCRRPTRPRGSQYREESLQNARRRRRRGIVSSRGPGSSPRLRVHLWAVAVPGPVASQEEVKSRPPFPTARQRLPFSCAVQRPSAVSLPQSSRAPCRAPQTVRRC